MRPALPYPLPTLLAGLQNALPKRLLPGFFPALWGGLLPNLLPGMCALCGGHAGNAVACAACHAHYIKSGGPSARCRCCAQPLPPAAANAQAATAGEPALCGACLTRPPAFDATWAVADYALPLDRLVLQLKFGGRLALARLFGAALAQTVLAAPGFDRPALLCPVPLGPGRLRERGYNQALEMARPLARALAIAVAPRLLRRVHDTQPQALTALAARQANVAHAFAVTDGAALAGRHIGLVDDVMTSGQTLNELAAACKRHGAARVTCLVFARTPPRLP